MFINLIYKEIYMNVTLNYTNSTCLLICTNTQIKRYTYIRFNKFVKSGDYTRILIEISNSD